MMILCIFVITNRSMTSIKNNFSLKSFNSFGIEVTASLFANPQTAEELLETLQSYDVSKLPFMVVGEGSNLLFTGDFEGLILHPEIKGIDLIDENEEEVIVSVGAGENWDNWVKYCVENAWYGLENLSLIPGSVGSAPVQNIGAYGVELKDRMEYLDAFDLREKRFVKLNGHACEFGYRTSIFKGKCVNRYIITQVVFKLGKKPKFLLDYGNVRKVFQENKGKTLQDLRDTIINIRETKLPDPKKYGNAGSFFKNPIIGKPTFKCIRVQYKEIPSYHANDNMVKIPAAWLIEKAGWKGKRIGNVGTWPDQPLVIVNYGGATGKEILEFSEMISVDIEKKFNISLEREVNVV